MFIPPSLENIKMKDNKLKQLIKCNQGVVKEDGVLKCTLCDYQINGNPWTRVKQHVKTKKHKDNIKLKNQTKTHLVILLIFLGAEK